MSSRITRNSAAKKLDSMAPDAGNTPQQLSSPPATPAPTNGKATARTKATPKSQKPASKEKPKTAAAPKTPVSNSKASSAAKESAKNARLKTPLPNQSPVPANTGRKRKRVDAAPKIEEDDDMLPHNMGKRPATKPKAKEREAHEEPEGALSAKQELKEEVEEDGKKVIGKTKVVVEDGPSPKKRAKKVHKDGLVHGQTPFPDWAHPTAEEAQTVHDLLIASFPEEKHHRFIQPDTIPPPSEQVAGCGEVPTILDALIRTLLSANTSGKNSNSAFQGLVKRFGLETEGVGKGSVSWNKVHEAPVKDVVEAIKTGGQQEKKGKHIKEMLAMVYEENEERRTALTKAKESGVKLTDEKEAEYQMLKFNILTLDYYHVLTTEEWLDTYPKYKGIGVKTAACVALFCMQRPCFAVDTHVFRLCQYLGWVPPDESRAPGQKKVDRNTTFSHCEVMIPDHLKYGLHQLFLEHGKNCGRCRAITSMNSAGWKDANCPLEHLVKRLGKKKGGVDTPKRTPKKGKKADLDDEEEEANDSDEEFDSSPSKITKKQRAASSTSKAGKTTPKKSPKKPTTPAKGAKVAKTARAQRTTKKALPKEETQETDTNDEEDVAMSDLTDAQEPDDDDEDDYKDQ
ncbi:hypothetical protein P7C71_g2661, partial [Lecanoromycetidae sp. Uapishka_2]